MRVGERIRAAREAAHKSQDWLGAQVGASQTAVSAWEGGRREPRREMVAKIADALGVTVEELETDGAADGPRPILSARKVKLVGYVGAGAEAHFASADDPAELVDAPEDATVNTVAAEVRGSSLGKAFDRWLVFYDDVRSPVTPDLYNLLCVVGTGDQVLVKIIRPATTEGRFHLISNADEEPLTDREVLWAAKVKGMRPR